ncbi:MAG: DUF805 domain-containing protein [Haemophilus parainfluenzae]
MRIYFILCVNIRYFRCFCFYRYWSNTFLVVFVVTLPPSISLTVRRLHDINLSGWFTYIYVNYVNSCYW